MGENMSNLQAPEFTITPEVVANMLMSDLMCVYAEANASELKTILHCFDFIHAQLSEIYVATLENKPKSKEDKKKREETILSIGYQMGFNDAKRSFVENYGRESIKISAEVFQLQ
jgi:hypothetical protein